MIGAAATTLPLSAYFAHHGTWQFLLNIAFYLKLYLPGVFTDRRLGGAVNGSLWSLFPEVLCYLALPLICLARSRLRGLVLFAVAVACGSGGLYMFAYHSTGYSLIYSADPKYVLAEVPFLYGRGSMASGEASGARSAAIRRCGADVRRDVCFTGSDR